MLMKVCVNCKAHLSYERYIGKIVYLRDIYGTVVNLCEKCYPNFQGEKFKPASWWYFEYIHAKDREYLEKKLFDMRRQEAMFALSNISLNREFKIFIA